jgi:hypothetical protein
MKKVKILCVLIILIGIGLFVLTNYFIPTTSVSFGWCIGLACALIILGFGFFINIMFSSSEDSSSKSNHPVDWNKETLKEKAGYLTCKIMTILLCIYILIMQEIETNPVILLLSVGLLLIHYLMNLFIYFYFNKRKDN